MQEVKYYVPKIEEFCVGFECEINDIKLNKPSTFKGGKFEDNWVKYKFDGRPLKWLQGYHSDISFFEIDLERIRVKYLDKEDIESLTFVFYKEFPVNYMEETCYTFHSEELNLMLGFYPKSSVISFATKDPSKNRVFLDTSVDPNRINMVKVKNKSEFKKLLKQIDIDGTN